MDDSLVRAESMPFMEQLLGLLNTTRLGETIHLLHSVEAGDGL